jgi:CHAT domain-containing protein
LGASRSEVIEIGKLYKKPTLLLGSDASERQLNEILQGKEARQYTNIHIATHAFVDATEPERSCVVLSQTDARSAGASTDGLLSVGEILDRYSLDSELVVLSACHTGLGRELRSEGYVGFTSAFFIAGARRVIVNLWGVDDNASKALMLAFYQNLAKRSMPPAHALSEAKRTIRSQKGSHPSDWASTVLVGLSN